MIVCAGKKDTVQDFLKASLLILDLAIEKTKKSKSEGIEKSIDELEAIKYKIIKFMEQEPIIDNLFKE